MDIVQIFVRRPGNAERRIIQLPIDSGDTVENIKKKVADKLGLCSGFLKVVFCGRRLSDETSVKDLRLGPQTCLTVTAVDEIPGLKDEIPSIMTDSEVDTSGFVMVGGQLEKPVFQAKANSFYVFCKSCKNLEAAKLRAYCNECWSDSVEFINEPTGWKDVIGSGKIDVECQACAKNTKAEFIFKCVGCNHEGAVLSHIQPNRGDHECLICGEVEPIIFALDCAHTSCVPCVSAYLEQINNQWLFVYKEDSGFTMRCAMIDCESYVKDPHHFYLMGEDNYKKFQRTSAEKFLHIQDGYHYCPFSDCGASFIIEESDEDGEGKRNICPECQRLFCLKCKSRGDCVCSTADTTNDLIRAISKPCPSCKVPTERSGGCSHMRCSHCGFNWCYVCGKEWGDNCQWSHWFD